MVAHIPLRPFAGSSGRPLLPTLQLLRSCPGLAPVGVEWLLPSKPLQHLGPVLFCLYLLSRGPSQGRNQLCFMNVESLFGAWHMVQGMAEVDCGQEYYGKYSW